MLGAGDIDALGRRLVRLRKQPSASTDPIPGCCGDPKLGSAGIPAVADEDRLGHKVTPNASCTPAAISRASATSSVVVPAPRFVSASVCFEEIAMPSGLPWPRAKPARSISHAAEVLT